MRLFSYLSLLLLLSSPVFSQMHSSTVSGLELLIVENGSVEASKFRLERVALEVLMPQASDNQVLYFEGDVKKDSFGNSWMYVEAKNPPRSFTYRREFLLNVSETKTQHIPSAYEVPDEFLVYLRPTGNVQSEDPLIRGLALNITRDSGSDFERIARLASWVYDNVEYDIRLKNESKDALWVLGNRVGTCDEFTTLFVAFARSLGMPARFVSGFYYGSGSWEEHAFAEVYLGSWVPVDATNLDVGGLDAAHLRFAVGKDNTVGSRIRVYGAEADSMKWLSQTEIYILNYSGGRMLDYDLHLSSESLEPGDSAVAVLHVKADEYALLRADLQPCISDFAFVDVDGTTRDIVLEPGEDIFAYWRLDVSELLKENVRYSCPLILNSKRLSLGEAVLNVTAQQEKNDGVSLSAYLSDPVLFYGSNQTVFISLGDGGSGSPLKLGVVSEGFWREFPAYPKTSLSVSFKPGSLGPRRLLVYSSDGSVVSLDYVVRAAEGIYVEDLYLPSLVLKGAPFEAVAVVRNNASSPSDLKLSVSFDSSESVQSLSVSDLSVVQIPFTVNETGSKRFSFRLRGGGVDQQVFRETRVYDVPDVLAESYFVPGKKALVVSLDVSGDAAKNITLSFGAGSFNIAELYGPGTYELGSDELCNITIEYQDMSGRAYSTHVVSEIRKEGFLDKLLRVAGELIALLLDLV